MWNQLYGHSAVHNLDYYTSDHRHVEISFGDAPNVRHRSHLIHFEEAWMGHVDYVSIVISGWHYNSLYHSPLSPTQKSKNCSTSLSCWGKLKVRGYGKRIRVASERVQRAIQDLVFWRGSREVVLSAQSILKSLLLDEEIYRVLAQMG